MNHRDEFRVIVESLLLWCVSEEPFHDSVSDIVLLLCDCGLQPEPEGVPCSFGSLRRGVNVCEAWGLGGVNQVTGADALRIPV